MTINEYHILAQVIRYHIAAVDHPEMKEIEQQHADVAKYFHGRGNWDYDIIYETVMRYINEEL